MMNAKTAQELRELGLTVETATMLRDIFNFHWGLRGEELLKVEARLKLLTNIIETLQAEFPTARLLPPRGGR